jgi:hypothetical protein
VEIRIKKKKERKKEKRDDLKVTEGLLGKGKETTEGEV